MEVSWREVNATLERAPTSWLRVRMVTGDERGEEVCSRREESCWMTKERE